MLWIEEAALAELRRHGEEAYPHESCGVLLGRGLDGARLVGAVERCANARHDRSQDRYVIDPRQILRVERLGRERGQEIVGFYHSHPDHPARWSATDLDEAHWLGCSYVITRVARGRAEDTNAFLLAGASEADKRFLDEEIRVGGREARAPEEEAR
jgi:proteasome lid subunit RPN8/RPN11